MPAPPADSPDAPGPTTDRKEPAAPARGLPQHAKILLGLVLGAALGIAAHVAYSRPVVHADALDLDANGLDDRLDWLVGNVVDPIGRVFLRLVLMVVVPLVVSALALAVVELGDLRRLGRVGLRALGYTLILSSVAVAVGVLLVNTIRPGDRLPQEKRDALTQQYRSGAEASLSLARRARPLKDALLDIIPENPLQEMAGAVDGSSKGNGILAVMFFSLALGAALAYVGPPGQTLVRLLEGLFAVSMAIIAFAMKLAPVGVGCLVFAMTARLGGELLVSLSWFVGTVMLGFLVQLAVTYPALLMLAGRRRPIRFFLGAREAMLVAFGTSSSNATLPTSLRVATEQLGIPPSVARFVLTVGATGNQNGTGLYEGVVVLFLAQVFGVELTVVQQAMVVLAAVFGGVGTAGVPGGSIPMVVVVLQSVGVPGESIAVILGIDRLLDMCRTVLNVTGDLVLAACVGADRTAGAG